MSQQSFLTALVEWLESRKVSYYLTGSLASSIHGEPRATHDVDLVVSITPDAVRDLITAFPSPRYYLDEQAANQAIRAGRSFNLIDSEEGYKADFWLNGREPFDLLRMSRRVRVESPYGNLWVASPEDTILSKLKWCQMIGGSEQQMRDSRRVYEVRYRSLDNNYLSEWAGRLGVADLLDKIRAEAKPLK